MAVDRKAFLRTLGDAPRSAKFGMLVVASYTLVAIFAPLIAPFTQSEVVSGPYEAASGTHLLGTDALGRDFFTRVVFGIRNTVGIALVTTIVTFVFGAFFGLLAAVRGGWVDQLLSRIVDVLMSIPALIFKLLLLSIAGTAVINLILSWPSWTRPVCSDCLELLPATLPSWSSLKPHGFGVKRCCL